MYGITFRSKKSYSVERNSRSDTSTRSLSDGEYDTLCQRLLAEWKDITHPHKKFLKKGSLKAGTGYNIKKYPTMVKSAAMLWKENS